MKHVQHFVGGKPWPTDGRQGDLYDPATGTRCPKATSICAEVVPPEDRLSETHRVACHHWRE